MKYEDLSTYDVEVCNTAILLNQSNFVAGLLFAFCIFFLIVVCLVVSRSAVNCLERLWSRMTCNVSPEGRGCC